MEYREDPRPWFGGREKQKPRSPDVSESTVELQKKLMEVLKGGSILAIEGAISEGQAELERLRGDAGREREAAMVEGVLSELENAKHVKDREQKELQATVAADSTPGWFRGLHTQPQVERSVEWFVEQLWLIAKGKPQALPVAKLASDLSHEMVHVATYNPDEIDEWVELFLQLNVKLAVITVRFMVVGAGGGRFTRGARSDRQERPADDSCDAWRTARGDIRTIFY